MGSRPTAGWLRLRQADKAIGTVVGCETPIEAHVEARKGSRNPSVAGRVSVVTGL